MKLVSVSDVKTFLEKTDSTHDSLLTLFVEKVSQRIESYLNRKLTKTSYTEYFSSTGKKYNLQAVPIATSPVPVITISGSSYTEDSEYYVWYDEGIIEFVSIPTTSLPKQIKIVYTGGYAADVNGILAVPDDLKYACILQAAADFRNRDNLGLRTLNLPDGSIGITMNDLIPSVRQILRQNRLIPSGRS